MGQAESPKGAGASKSIRPLAEKKTEPDSAPSSAFCYPWAIAPTINTTKPVATAIATFVSTDKFIIFSLQLWRRLRRPIFYLSLFRSLRISARLWMPRAEGGRKTPKALVNGDQRSVNSDSPRPVVRWRRRIRIAECGVGKECRVAYAKASA